MDIHQAAAPPEIQCRLNGREEAGLLRLQGEVESGRDIAGTFRLRLVKTGPAGSADLQQGGAFTLRAGTVETVGTTSISLEAGAHLTAILTLETPGGRHECRHEQHGAARL